MVFRICGVNSGDIVVSIVVSIVAGKQWSNNKVKCNSPVLSA